jgi:hypothetical protein
MSFIGCHMIEHESHFPRAMKVRLNRDGYFAGSKEPSVTLFTGTSSTRYETILDPIDPGSGE